jgi:hypothetical protein
VKFDENAWSSRSWETLAKVEGETFTISNDDPEKSEISESDQQGSIGGINALVPPISAKKPRWISQTLRYEQEQVGAPKTSHQVSHPPKKNSIYFALLSSIIDTEPYSYEEAGSEQV